MMTGLFLQCARSIVVVVVLLILCGYVLGICSKPLKPLGLIGICPIAFCSSLRTMDDCVQLGSACGDEGSGSDFGLTGLFDKSHRTALHVYCCCCC